MPNADALIGHEEIIRFFNERLTNGVLSHAYLFFGPERIGKTTLLRTLAQTILCDGECSGACISCTAFIKGLHPDFFFLDGETEHRISIDVARDIGQHARLVPSRGKNTVIAVSHIDRCTHEAANALLKLFEDPPRRTIILCSTHAPGRIPVTLRSRMERIRCKRVPAAYIEKRWNAKLAHAANGRPGYAARAAEEPETLEQQEKEYRTWRLFFHAPQEHFAALVASASDRDALQSFLTSAQTVLRDCLHLDLQEKKKSAHRRGRQLQSLLRTRRLLQRTNASPHLLFEDFLLTCFS